MAWPNDPLDVTVELYTGSWTDIPSYVLVRDGIHIRRGFPDEGSTPEPGSCTLTLKNQDGRFSPRNPTSPYYGLIGRNTPIRARIGGELCGAQHMAIEGTAATDRATTPDHASLDITGDIDIRIDAAYDTWWTASTTNTLAAKYITSGNQRSWALQVTTDGSLQIIWSTDGTSGTALIMTSTTTAGLVDGERKALRVTLDVDDGAGNRVATFYTADTIDGTWTQLGSTVTTAGTTSIFSSSADLEVGHATFSTAFPTGRVYAFELRDGIDGTVVADPDFREQDTDPYGDTDPFTDDAGREWTLNGDTRIHDPGIRFVGEVSEWPARWDLSGQDVTVPVTAQGIQRRLGQGSSPLRSALASAILASSPTAYWSLGDGPEAEWLALSSGAGGNFGLAPLGSGTSGAVVQPGGTEELAPWLGRALLLGDGTDVGAIAAAVVLPATPTRLVVDVVVDNIGSNDAGSVAFVQFPAVGVTEPGDRWNLSWGGFLDIAGVINGSTDNEQVGSVDLSGTHHLRMDLAVDGSDVDYDAYLDGELTLSGTYPNVTLQNLGYVRLLGEDAAFTDAAVWADSDPVDITLAASAALLGAAGEQAHERAERLCEHNSVPFRLVGSPSSTALMGYQTAESSLIDNLNETWQVDLALLYESRHELGLSWRARETLYNQDVAVTLDYDADGEVGHPLSPTDDDRYVRNDIEVRRKDGSSARAVDSTSRMGTQNPPSGVGRYEHSVTLNLYADGQLDGHAHWLLHLGTWDESRFPTVHINLLALAAHSKTSLIEQIAGLDVGDRIRLSNLPVYSGAVEDVDLMVLGFEETIGVFDWGIVLNCVPYGPYDVGEYQDTDASGDVPRYDTAGCETSAGLRLPETSGAYASTPDDASLDITGDIDLRAEATADNWTPGAIKYFISKYNATSDQRSYALRLDAAGTISIAWSTNGSSFVSASSTVAPTVSNGNRLAVRATMDVDDGASGRIVTFYTADSIAGPWTQLGNTVTGVNTSIFSGTAALEVGSFSDGTAGLWAGIIHAAQVYDGIDGTKVADVHFDDQAAGDTSFDDDAGLTWTVNGDAVIYNGFVSGTDTELLVSTTAGPPWTTDPPGGWPILIRVAGAVLSVTGISGSSSTQTFTVSTTVANGIEKTIPVGSPVRVFRPGYYAL